MKQGCFSFLPLLHGFIIILPGFAVQTGILPNILQKITNRYIKNGFPLAWVFPGQHIQQCGYPCQLFRKSMLFYHRKDYIAVCWHAAVFLCSKELSQS